MTWTDPKTFTVGELLTAADLNTYVRDNLDFLYRKPIVTVRLTSTQAVANASDHVVQWDEAEWDYADTAMWDAGTPGSIVIDRPGIYDAQHRIVDGEPRPGPEVGGQPPGRQQPADVDVVTDPLDMPLETVGATTGRGMDELDQVAKPDRQAGRVVGEVDRDTVHPTVRPRIADHDPVGERLGLVAGHGQVADRKVPFAELCDGQVVLRLVDGSVVKFDPGDVGQLVGVTGRCEPFGDR